MVDRVRKFIRERFAEPVTQPSLLNADQVGYTWEEYERLKSRGGPKFAVARAGLKSGRPFKPRHRSRLAERFRFRTFARLRLRK